jgi:FkbM family methyltransferase
MVGKQEINGEPSVLESLIRALPSLKDQHSPTTEAYALLKRVARQEIEARFAGNDETTQDFGPIGKLVFPYHKMGAVDSLDLFGLDELIIFSFYWSNRNRYRHVLDAGANIGLHSITLSRCGMDVRSYEPDPETFKVFELNLALNGCSNVDPVNAAISTEAGQTEFVRVLGNTTGSHLAGAKPNPYGELERFPVTIEPFKPLIEWADLIKMDVEGHESTILVATTREDWLNTDALVEIGSPENASDVFNHFKDLEVGLFSQKTGWERVKTLDDMPVSYKEGSLFISCKDEMPWQ